MQLFFSPGASSLAPHIALREAGLAVELVRVDLEAGVVSATGEAFDSINPMRKVPALRLPDGTLLTETLAVLAYIAELDPRGAPTGPARYRMFEVMSFIATELHKGFSPMFDPDVPGVYKQHLLADPRPFVALAKVIEHGPYVLGEQFSVADAHLFTILRLGKVAGLAFPPAIERYLERVARRPAVISALRAEGVISDGAR